MNQSIEAMFCSYSLLLPILVWILILFVSVVGANNIQFYVVNAFQSNVILQVCGKTGLATTTPVCAQPTLSLEYATYAQARFLGVPYVYNLTISAYNQTISAETLLGSYFDAVNVSSSYSYLATAYIGGYTVATNTRHLNFSTFTGSTNPNAASVLEVNYFFYEPNITKASTVSSITFDVYTIDGSQHGTSTIGAAYLKLAQGGSISETIGNTATYIYTPSTTIQWSYPSGQGITTTAAVNCGPSQILAILGIGYYFSSTNQLTPANSLTVLSPPLEYAPPTFVPTQMPSYSPKPSFRPTMAPTSASQSTSNSSSSLNGGVLAGIIIVVIFGTALIAGISFMIYRLYCKPVSGSNTKSIPMSGNHL